MVLIMVSVISAGLFRPPADQDNANRDPIHPAGLRVMGDAPAFTLIDQMGKVLSSDSLKGKVYVANFIFTHCAGPCRAMTQRMAQLEKDLNDSSVQFVSISVDPKRDTPDVLKAYGEQFGADAATWKFGTGDASDVQRIARGMLQPFEPASEGKDILHSERFILIDAAGKIRATCHAKEGDFVKFMTDIKTVADEAKAAK
jgi:protein SCO1/2